MNKYELASQGLILVGHRPIASFDEPTSGSMTARELYEETILELLGAHRWTFAKRATQMARLSAAPATEWEAAYTLPAGVTIVYAVQVDGEDIEFDRYGGEIHCNARAEDVVVVVEGFYPAEATWPPYFRSAARMKLASVFAIPVAESEQKASIYEGKFVRAMTNAKLMDSQGRTAAKLPVGGLARYHGGRP